MSVFVKKFYFYSNIYFYYFRKNIFKLYNTLVNYETTREQTDFIKFAIRESN